MIGIYKKYVYIIYKYNYIGIFIFWIVYKYVGNYGVILLFCSDWIFVFKLIDFVFGWIVYYYYVMQCL